MYPILQEKLRIKNREAYDKKVGKEATMLHAETKRVSKMEREEMELIQRLQNTQLLQQHAYEELEGALKGKERR